MQVSDCPYQYRYVVKETDGLGLHEAGYMTEPTDWEKAKQDVVDYLQSIGVRAVSIVDVERVKP